MASNITIPEGFKVVNQTPAIPDGFRIVNDSPKNTSQPIVQDNSINYNDLLDSTNNVAENVLGAMLSYGKGANFGIAQKLGALLGATTDKVYDLGGSAGEVLANIKNKGIQNAFDDMEEKPSFSENYDKYNKEYKDAYNKFNKEHPVASVAAGLYGGFKGKPQQAINQVYKFIDPVVKNSKLATKLLAKGTALGTIGGGTNVLTNTIDSDNKIDYLKNDALGDFAVGGATNIAIPVGINVTGKTVKGGIKLGSKVLGVTTGAGNTAINNAVDAGKRESKVFLDNMRGKINPEEVVDTAMDRLDGLKKSRALSYEQSMEMIKRNPKKLDVAPIERQVKRLISKETGVPYSKKGNDEYLVDEPTQKLFSEVKSILNRFHKDTSRHNTKGFDQLKKRISGIVTKPDTNAERVKTEIVNSIRGEIMSQNPTYKKAMDNYAKSSNEIDTLKRTFSLDNRANPETILRKLQSITRNNANTSFNYRSNLLNRINSDKSISDAISGQALHTWTPRGVIGGVGGVFSAKSLSPTTLAFSPRLVGEIAYGAGRASNKVNMLIDALLSPKNYASGLNKKDKK